MSSSFKPLYFRLDSLSFIFLASPCSSFSLQRGNLTAEPGNAAIRFCNFDLSFAFFLHSTEDSSICFGAISFSSGSISIFQKHRCCFFAACPNLLPDSHEETTAFRNNASQKADAETVETKVSSLLKKKYYNRKIRAWLNSCAAIMLSAMLIHVIHELAILVSRIMTRHSIKSYSFSLNKNPSMKKLSVPR